MIQYKHNTLGWIACNNDRFPDVFTIQDHSLQSGTGVYFQMHMSKELLENSKDWTLLDPIGDIIINWDSGCLTLNQLEATFTEDGISNSKIVLALIKVIREQCKPK